MTNRSVIALLDALIDYAGLFPPAGLGMREAVRNYATNREGPYSWALARFICPASRLRELHDEWLAARVSAMPLRMRCFRSSFELTRMCRRNVRAIFEKAHSIRLSQEPCLGV